ncbi:MAG: XylR N-terminal domain-containing protein, partial [Gammaproteobacteria bacterium]|nr:XylR N-terminal domain-containing protein [Gammaproteobacteria bacterium]
MNAATVPKELQPLMQNAEEYVQNYFAQFRADPTQGTIEIGDERYILIRAASISVDFFETIKQLYQGQGEEQAHNITWQLLFDLAHALGKQDANDFHQKKSWQSTEEKLAVGPALFTHLGWAHVKISPESNLTTGDDFVLVYDHTYSFEADAWLKQNKTSELPVCIMNAGYSSGWTSVSYNTPLIATEIMCRAKGDHACRFIMAPPERIEQHIKNYLKQKPKLMAEVTKYEIPDFFLRKRLEEELRKSEEKYRIQFEEAIDATFM